MKKLRDREVIRMIEVCKVVPREQEGGDSLLEHQAKLYQRQLAYLNDLAFFLKKRTLTRPFIKKGTKEKEVLKEIEKHKKQGDKVSLLIQHNGQVDYEIANKNQTLKKEEKVPLSADSIYSLTKKYGYKEFSLGKRDHLQIVL